MLELTPAQIAQFREDGFLIVEKAIDLDLVERVRSRFEPLFLQQDFETGMRPDEVNLPQGDPPYTQQICNGWRGDRTIASLSFKAEVGRAIAQLAGFNGTRLVVDNVLWKPPAGRPIGFHQDSAYLYWLDRPELVTCWVSLDQTSADGGPIMYVRGSHRWGNAAPILQFHGPDDDLREAREWAEARGETLDLVPVVVPPGGVAFHSGWTWHGSRVNRSDQHRRSLAIHCCAADVRYNPAGFMKGTGPVYSRYMHFGSDVVDENYFPITWHESGYRTPGLDDYIAHGWSGAAAQAAA